MGLDACLRRGLRWRSSMVESESLARGGVMTLTLDDNLDNAFPLDGGVCVFVWVARSADVALCGSLCRFSSGFPQINQTTLLLH